MGGSAGDLDNSTGIEGGTDGTKIGNTGDRLKVDSTITLNTSGAAFVFGDRTTAALTRVVIERTTYTEQTSNAQRSIASSSASDTAAGTGARQVKITYLTSAGLGPYSETVTLNGTSYVNTAATDICFIEALEVTSVGSGGVNAGTITLKAATAGGGATIWTIATGDNRTLSPRHYVPDGKHCLITGISCSHNGTTVGSGAVFTINAKTLNSSTAPEQQVSDFVRLYGQSSTFARDYQSPIHVHGPSRIQVYLTPESSSSFTYRAAVDFTEI